MGTNNRGNQIPQAKITHNLTINYIMVPYHKTLMLEICCSLVSFPRYGCCFVVACMPLLVTHIKINCFVIQKWKCPTYFLMRRDYQPLLCFIESRGNYIKWIQWKAYTWGSVSISNVILDWLQQCDRRNRLSIWYTGRQ